MDQATTSSQADAASVPQQPMQVEEQGIPRTGSSQEVAISASTETEDAVTSTPVPSNLHNPQQQPVSLTSSLHRTSTPSLLPADESFVESWIQQSLTMPSATHAGDGESNASFHIDAGVPATRHRRERSLGSGFLVESDYSGIYQTALPTSTSMSNMRALQSVPVNSANDNRSRHQHSSSHPFFLTSDFHHSWSNHSANDAASGSTVSMPHGGTGSTMEDVLNSSAPSSLGAVVFPLTPSSDRPLAVSRVSSVSPSARDDEHATASTAVSSVIHDAARITSWHTVIELCRTQPEAAAYVGRDGWTALHHACNRRCPVPEAVEALIQAYPDALLVEEEKGWLPLHYACRFKAPKEVVRLLLHMYPEKGKFGVSRADRKGRTPLWYAVRYEAPVGVAGLLLEVDPSAVLEEDQNSETPLAVVWDQHAEKLDGKRALNRILGVGLDETGSQHSTVHLDGRGHNASDLHGVTHVAEVDLVAKAKTVQKRLESQKKWLEKWNTVNVFLKAAFGFALDDDWEMVDGLEEKKDYPTGRKWRILHAISAIKCHHSLFSLASALHPEQAFEVDDNDLKRTDKIYQSNGVMRSPMNLTALHLAASSPANEDVGRMIINHLLAMNPQAARSVDTEGSTPLHRMAENKHKANWHVDGARELYDANTDAARLVDMNGRLPLHRAARGITYFNGVDDEVAVSRSKICHLLEENGDGAHHADSFGCLALHIVAQHGKGWDVQTETLYNANQAAVRTRTGVKYGNRLPLHLAASNPESEFSMVGRLVELNPRGASQADRKGRFPLHLACEVGLCWKSIAAIHEAYPEAIRQPEQNDRGWMALHMAAFAKNADLELLSNLVQLHPEAASVADKNEQFPLHLACMAGKTWETGLSTLFDANPNAISCFDNNGLLPLHIVSFLYAAEKATKECGPRFIDVRSRRLSKSAAALEAEQATARELEEARKIGNIFNLIKADPTVLST
jgi:ankyrin repeat protein